MPNLTTVDLSANRISSEGAKEIASMTNLTTLILTGNHIRSEGAKEISEHDKSDNA